MTTLCARTEVREQQTVPFSRPMIHPTVARAVSAKGSRAGRRRTGPAAGASVAVATLPSRGLPRCVQFSVAIDSGTGCPNIILRIRRVLPSMLIRPTLAVLNEGDSRCAREAQDRYRRGLRTGHLIRTKAVES